MSYKGSSTGEPPTRPSVSRDKQDYSVAFLVDQDVAYINLVWARPGEWMWKMACMNASLSMDPTLF
jgi:hypothetical protein